MTSRHLPLVRDFMDRYVETISPEMDIIDAVDFLLEKRITGALVADKDQRLVGILTELDCLRLITLGDEVRHETPRGKVKDYMVAQVETISPTLDVYYCAGLFMNVPFRRFPVVDNGRIVGAITRFDLLRAVRGGLQRRARDESMSDVP